MKKIIITLTAMIVALLCVGCSTNNEKTPEQTTEEETAYELGSDESVYEDFIYDTENNLELDAYFPKAANSNGGIIVMIHGGAWIEGDKTNDYTQKLWNNLQESGYALAKINFRDASENTDANALLDDIQKALETLTEISSENNIYIQNAMLVGWSSGGHLAELYSYTRAEKASIKVKCVCAYSGISDLSEKSFYNENPLESIINTKVSAIVSNLANTEFDEKTVTKVKDSLLVISPINYVSTSVPTIICHSKIDKLVNYSTAVSLKEALVNAGQKVTFIDFPNSGHDLLEDPESLEESYGVIKEFADTYLIVSDIVDDTYAE